MLRGCKHPLSLLAIKKQVFVMTIKQIAAMKVGDRIATDRVELRELLGSFPFREVNEKVVIDIKVNDLVAVLWTNMSREQLKAIDEVNLVRKPDSKGNRKFPSSLQFRLEQTLESLF